MKFSEFLTEAKVEMLKSREDITAWLDKLRIRNYTINDDLSIDVQGKVKVDNADIKQLPVKFNNVHGDFTMTNCDLKSLAGMPRMVKGDFNVSKNHLQSLSGGPVAVYGSYACKNNKLTELRSPLKMLGSDFSCDRNPLKTLKGMVKEVAGHFICDNTDIVNFEGGPSVVAKSFSANYCNNLTSIDGLPATVGDRVNITGNPKLTTLHGVSKNLKSCKSITVPSLVTKDILGLLKLNKECQLDAGYVPHDSDLSKAIAILFKYRGRSDVNDAIFDCQEELVAAGLDDYANL